MGDYGEEDDWEDDEEDGSYTTDNAATAEELARFWANLHAPLPEDVRRMLAAAEDDMISEAEYRLRHKD